MLGSEVKIYTDDEFSTWESVRILHVQATTDGVHDSESVREMRVQVAFKCCKRTFIFRCSVYCGIEGRRAQRAVTEVSEVYACVRNRVGQGRQR